MPGGLAAYGLSLMAIMPFAVLPGLYTGPLARLIGGVDLGWLAGIVVPSLVYYGFAQSLDLDRERMVIARCEVP